MLLTVCVSCRQYMSESWVALACQRDAPSEHAVALSALVHALKQEKKAAGGTQDTSQGTLLLLDDSKQFISFRRFHTDPG